MELWELAAREAIRETVAAYAQCADSGRFKELCALFAADGTLEIEGQPPLRGRDAIHDFLTGVALDLAGASSSRMIRHNVSSLRIDVTSEHEATGRSYFLAITETGVDHWGRYADVYIPGEGVAWLFAYRKVRTDGRIAGGFADGRQG